MARIDAYLRSLERFGAQSVILQSDQSVTLRFATGDRHATQVTPHDQLVSMVREVAPPAALDSIDGGRRARFELASAGGRFLVAVAAPRHPVGGPDRGRDAAPRPRHRGRRAPAGGAGPVPAPVLPPSGPAAAAEEMLIERTAARRPAGAPSWLDEAIRAAAGRRRLRSPPVGRRAPDGRASTATSASCPSAPRSTARRSSASSSRRCPASPTAPPSCRPRSTSSPGWRAAGSASSAIATVWARRSACTRSTPPDPALLGHPARRPRPDRAPPRPRPDRQPGGWRPDHDDARADRARRGSGGPGGVD